MFIMYIWLLIVDDESCSKQSYSLRNVCILPHCMAKPQQFSHTITHFIVTCVYLAFGVVNTNIYGFVLSVCFAYTYITSRKYIGLRK